MSATDDLSELFVYDENINDNVRVLIIIRLDNTRILVLLITGVPDLVN